MSRVGNAKEAVAAILKFREAMDPQEVADLCASEGSSIYRQVTGLVKDWGILRFDVPARALVNWMSIRNIQLKVDPTIEPPAFNWPPDLDEFIKVVSPLDELFELSGGRLHFRADFSLDEQRELCGYVGDHDKSKVRISYGHR